MKSFALILTLLCACTKQEPSAERTPEDALVKRGRAAYNSNCATCHNSDPTRDGVLGPAIFGSPRELIEARVLRAEYPVGYKPKRTSKVMVALPQVKADLEALAAFLNKN